MFAPVLRSSVALAIGHEFEQYRPIPLQGAEYLPAAPTPPAIRRSVSEASASPGCSALSTGMASGEHNWWARRSTPVAPTSTGGDSGAPQQQEVPQASLVPLAGPEARAPVDAQPVDEAASDVESSLNSADAEYGQLTSKLAHLGEEDEDLMAAGVPMLSATFCYNAQACLFACVCSLQYFPYTCKCWRYRLALRLPIAS